MFSEPVESEKSKEVNRKRSPSVLRGAEFMRDFSAFSRLSRLSVSTGSSATSVAKPTPHTPRPNYSSWWREQLRRYRHSGLIKAKRRPITWAKAPSILKLEFYHRALASFGEVRTFTLRLRTDLEAEAKAKPDACDWLRRRIAFYLKEELGRSVDLFGCFEEDRFEALHVHGAFVVTDNELKAAKRALRLAGGEWKKRPERQAHNHPYAPDEGWASYCGKNLYLATPFVRGLLSRHGSPKLLISYAGNPLFVSRELGQRAKALFEAARWRLLKGMS